MTTYLATRMMQIADDPNRASLRELRVLAIQVARMENFLDELVGDAAENVQLQARMLRELSREAAQ